MIEITDYKGRSHFVSANGILKISEAGLSSKWHGIQSIVKLFDGTTIEARDACHDIAKRLTDAAI